MAIGHAGTGPTTGIDARGGPLLHFPEAGRIQGPPFGDREFQFSPIASTHEIHVEGRRSELTE